MSLLDADLGRLTHEALVPGAAFAIIQNGQLGELASLGIRGTHNPAPVDEDTVFDAASLSKPVFAYIALHLVDRGQLRLDGLVSGHLPNYITDDPRSALITVGHVLSHSAGLPNWRNFDYPLRTYFEPGGRFSYSGEGFLYLQRAIEAVTGEKLNALARRLVFEPPG